MAHGVDSQGSIPGRGKRFSSTSQYPEWLCNPLLFYPYQGKISLELRNHLGPEIETSFTERE
jgi:hypothetical protein